MIKQISIKTKFGWISAFEQKKKIVRVEFRKNKSKLISQNLKKFKKNIKNYTSKRAKTFKCNVLLNGSPIQIKIWKELKKIRFGKTKSYGAIAKKYKLSPRHVGKICGQNKIPLIIPCHRVIRSNGTLGGFSAPGGISLKKKLLDFESN